MVHEINGDRVAMKTMRFMHEYTDRNFDRHRKDALVMERLSSSPNVVDLFSNCGSTTLTEFANQGSVSNISLLMKSSLINLLNGILSIGE